VGVENWNVLAHWATGFQNCFFALMCWTTQWWKHPASTFIIILYSFWCKQLENYWQNCFPVPFTFRLYNTRLLNINCFLFQLYLFKDWVSTQCTLTMFVKFVIIKEQWRPWLINLLHSITCMHVTSLWLQLLHVAYNLLALCEIREQTSGVKELCMICIPSASPKLCIKNGNNPYSKLIERMIFFCRIGYDPTSSIILWWLFIYIMYVYTAYMWDICNCSQKI